MIRPEYFQRLVDASPVRLYCSGIDGARAWWPWRMNKAGSPEFREAFVDACDHHLLDSNFNDKSVTNRDVLDEAEDAGSDGAVLADVYQDGEATVDALLAGLELYDDHPFDGLLVLPLQAPYAESHAEVSDSVGGLDVWWAIGGLKDADARVKIEETKALREAIGPEPHLHGLGYGVTDEIARVVRRAPGLLDSIDNSTSYYQSREGSGECPKLDVTTAPGTEVASVTAARMNAERIDALRSLTHFAADDDDPDQLRPQWQAELPTEPPTPAVTDGGDP